MSGATKGTTDFKDFSAIPYYLLLLLALLLGRPHFCFSFFNIKGLAISGAESRGKNIAVGFSQYFLWKVLINYQKCMTADKGSQVFFFLDNPFTKRGNRGLAFDRCRLPISHTPRCQWLLWPHTLCCFWLQILSSFLALAEHCLLAYSLWYLASVVICRIHCISSTL